jgi:hypothetical protein
MEFNQTKLAIESQPFKYLPIIFISHKKELGIGYTIK